MSSGVLKLAFMAAGRYYPQIPMKPKAMKTPTICLLLALALVSGCTPTVQVAMPNEPITINLNVKIEHEIRVRVDQELEQVFEQNADLF